MSTEFNLDEFLGEAEFVDDGEKEAVSKFLSREKNKGFVLRQSDYDRKMNAGKKELAETLATRQGEIEARQATLDDLISRNLAYKSDAEKAVEAAQIRTQKAEIKGLYAAQRAGFNSLDEIEIEDDTPRKPKTDAPDSAALKKEFTDELQRIAKGSLEMNLALREVEGEHLELTGKHLKSTRPLLAEWAKDLQKNDKITLMDTANRFYEFDKYRDENSKKAVDAEVDKRVKEIEAKLRQEMSENGGLPSPRNGAPVPAIFRKSEKRDPERGQKAALAYIQGEA